MQPFLVVVDSTEPHERLVREAGRVAAATGTPLVLLSWLTEDRLEEDTDTLQAMKDALQTSFETNDARELAAQFVRETANEEFTNIGDSVEYDVITIVADESDLADEVLRVAEERGCGHIYVAGRQRSPTGKALFGDTAQRVILNFDGLVTVLTE
ncbi:universal stress protein (plasmid) [Halorarum halophilum]|uniref:Universal stress protein n=1 Tax=Halorarum halophilum TaxID=2743090 RepID=A0A7D5GHH6_9EURY|nr:universal stress protein [Halobaculum halophilum]QLG29948.1 universal stress protein [Halobaculum halophilum]